MREMTVDLRLESHEDSYDPILNQVKQLSVVQFEIENGKPVSTKILLDAFDFI